MRAAAADDGASAVDVIVRGRIIGRRRVSKRLAFYDVRVDDALDAAAVGADDATLRDDGRRARAHATAARQSRGRHSLTGESRAL